jgi:hypothetical protein
MKAPAGLRTGPELFAWMYLLSKKSRPPALTLSCFITGATILAALLAQSSPSLASFRFTPLRKHPIKLISQFLNFEIVENS